MTGSFAFFFFFLRLFEAVRWKDTSIQQSNCEIEYISQTHVLANPHLVLQLSPHPASLRLYTPLPRLLREILHLPRLERSVLELHLRKIDVGSAQFPVGAVE